MFSVKPLSTIASVIACISLLSGCAGVTSVKEVTNDPSAYISKKFSVASLPPEISKKIPVDTIRSGQERITFVTEATQEDLKQKKDSWTTTITLNDLGNGIFQRTRENSNNNIPYAITYSMTYRGIGDLRWQTIPLNRSMTAPLYVVKEITRFDPVPTSVNQTFSYEYQTGTETQVANFAAIKVRCKTTREFAAKAIHSKLTGTALEFECEIFANNILQNRTKWVLLKNYGVAIQTESVGSTNKIHLRVIDVKS